MDSNQLIFKFDLKNPNNFKEENFIFCDENKTAVNFLNKFFSQEEFSQNAIVSAIIKGEKCSGKTHLLNIFAHKFDVKILKKTDLTDKNFTSLFEKNHFYILDDIDEVGDELLFHVINYVFEAKAFLLMSAKNPNVFSLKDLNSRIKNIFTVEIKNPEIELITMLLAKTFSRRQLKIANEVIEFLANNLERKYEVIFNAAEKIEKFCFESFEEKKKKITILDVKKILNL